MLRALVSKLASEPSAPEARCQRRGRVLGEMPARSPTEEGLLLCAVLRAFFVIGNLNNTIGVRRLHPTTACGMI